MTTGIHPPDALTPGAVDINVLPVRAECGAADRIVIVNSGAAHC